MKKYIAYYRVSTKRQGRSGLGLEDQRQMIEKGTTDGEIIAFFTEIESRKKNDRVELNKAIALCKKENAILVVAKLDRLSGKVAFLFNLRESGVVFKCLDIPELTTLTLGMYATFAQHEVEKISERTKAALAVKKAQGKKLGNPYVTELNKNRKKYCNEEARTNNQMVVSYIKSLKDKENLSFEKIAKRLNGEGYETTMGKLFHKQTVAYLYAS